MIRLKEWHYLAIYHFAEEVRMVEIAKTNEKDARELAMEYGEWYADNHNNVSWELAELILIPDCIGVVS